MNIFWYDIVCSIKVIPIIGSERKFEVNMPNCPVSNISADGLAPSGDTIQFMYIYIYTGPSLKLLNIGIKVYTH